MVCVGVGFQNRPEVNGIADDPDTENTAYINTIADMDNVVEKVINAACG